MGQLTLGLSLKDEATFDNFYAANNAELIIALKQVVSGQGEQTTYLCGMRGQGRSHLLQACCHAASYYHLRSAYLPLEALISLTPEVLDGFESLDLVCLDDVNVIAGRSDWEEAVFNLYNRLFDKGSKVVIVADEIPKSIHLSLPDLVSRLASGVVYQLHPLTDEEKLAALVMRASRRGMSLSEEVGKFILTHCSRHMDALFVALDKLDNASLALQRRLTIPFVKEVLCI
jgi:DnaA family protein